MTLDPPPSSASMGDTVTFSGMLTTSDGKYVIPGKTVYIKDDIAFAPDAFLATVTTDNNGKFSASWTVTAKNNGNTYHVYAVFEGDSQVSDARSSEYAISITSQSSNQGSSSGSSSSSSSSNYYYSNLILNSIPSVVNVGDTVSISGTLMTSDGKYAISGRQIYIKDDISLDTDTVLGSVVTDTNGKFSATWKATAKSGGGDYNFYAVFNGDAQVQKARSQEYRVSVISQSTNTNQGSSSSSSSGNVNYLPTEITLDQIPSQVYAENEIVFSGKLTSNGQPIANALVHIQKNIPAFPDEELVNGTTDANGQFSIHWTAKPGKILKNFGVYAIFEGSGNYEKVRSNDQHLTVQKYVPEIKLTLPTSANVGDGLIFSGTLHLGGGANPEGYVVYIKDEVVGPDNLLATAYVNANGNFLAGWVVHQLHKSGLAHIYAVFEGDQAHSRVTTCDTGPTSSIGGSCLNTIVLSISGANLSPPPPELELQSHLPTPEKLNGNEYIELKYSLPLSSNPVVAIAPDSESYDKVQRYVTPVKDGIRMWTNDLQQKFGGNWNVEFVELKKGIIHLGEHPDIIINIVTRNEEEGCNQTYYGVTLQDQVMPQITVCVNDATQSFNDSRVSATSAHEFIHAMGLGHAFNKEGDRMCSAENGVDTCPNLNNRSLSLSDFDVAAVAKIYGKDGFIPPNNAISNGDKFTASEYQNQNYGTITNPNTPQPKGFTTQDQTIHIPNRVRTIALWWSEDQISDNTFAISIQYLIQQKILQVPITSNGDLGNTNIHVPSLKSVAKLWASGQISDDKFVKAIQDLIRYGLIKV